MLGPAIPLPIKPKLYIYEIRGLNYIGFKVFQLINMRFKIIITANILSKKSIRSFYKN